MAAAGLSADVDRMMDNITGAVLIVLIVLAINIVWAIGLAADYRASRFGWLLFGVLIPPIGIARGVIVMVRARRR